VKEKKATPWSFAANAAIGALVALGLVMLFLLGASFLVVSGRMPEGMMGGVVVVVLFVSSLVGAIVAIRRAGSRALFVGLFEGAILYAITFVGGAFAAVPSLFGRLSVFLLAAAVLGGGLAGFLRARPKKRKL